MNTKKSLEIKKIKQRIYILGQKICKKIFLLKILLYHCMDKDEEIASFTKFIRKHLSMSNYLYDKYSLPFIFGAEWPLEYSNKKYEIFIEDNYKYVLYRKKKIYMPTNMNDFQIESYIRSIEIEQDRRSAHCYFPEKIDLNDKVLVDVGGAEGAFAIDYIDIIKKLYIFEADKKWIGPLKKTYQKWKDKVTVYNAFVGDGENGTVRLDQILRNEQIDIIKADVEGMELDVIKGAKGLFRCNKKLKIFACLYHDGNDEIRINNYLKQFSCKYRNGRMLFLWDKSIKKPYIRHGVAEYVYLGENENS